MHDHEVKVRLTDTDAGLLRAKARRMDIPTAATGRAILRQALNRPVAGIESGTRKGENGRPSEGLSTNGADW